MSGSETLSTNSLIIFIIYVVWYDGACGSHRTSLSPKNELEYLVDQR